MTDKTTNQIVATIGIAAAVAAVILAANAVFGQPEAEPVHESPYKISASAPTNQDALFEASIAGTVPQEKTEWARAEVKQFCLNIDSGMTGAESLDSVLSPLTTSDEVVWAAAAIGGGVQSYCPEHLDDMLSAAEAMGGEAAA